jgi:ribulose bisphosphate carboxylase small subunit
MRAPLLPLIRLSGSSTASSSSNITDSEDKPWTLIGEAKDHLRAELEQLYWTGVEHELESVLFTLRTWQSHKFSEITLADESEDFVHGFDTFIDQVSEESREFADQLGKLKDQVNPSAKRGYIQALEHSAQHVATEQKSSQLKAAIRQSVEDQEFESPLRRQTRMLLQAIGLLDIEKLVEYRPPLDKLSF